ncbi:hypothetical protein PHMEG_00023791 [Phytophthora megakarya]|uniref:Uncharacterized protein n=1 Tax=Phytophthora megakarya TaxID=4795 RepID=A0A225VFI6_9STRA|nr:hypothetical protein PHMEG_00023791 [Phytophthora megakarya]
MPSEKRSLLSSPNSSVKRRRVPSRKIAEPADTQGDLASPSKQSVDGDEGVDYFQGETALVNYYFTSEDNAKLLQQEKSPKEDYCMVKDTKPPVVSPSLQHVVVQVMSPVTGPPTISPFAVIKVVTKMPLVTIGVMEEANYWVTEWQLAVLVVLYVVDKFVPTMLPMKNSVLVSTYNSLTQELRMFKMPVPMYEVDEVKEEVLLVVDDVKKAVMMKKSLKTLTPVDVVVELVIVVQRRWKFVKILVIVEITQWLNMETMNILRWRCREQHPNLDSVQATQIDVLKQQLNLQEPYVAVAALTTSNIRVEMSELVRLL